MITPSTCTTYKNMITPSTCTTGCCRIESIPYHHVNFQKNDGYFVRPHEVSKAGCFIYDQVQQKILLVQTRGLCFGPPKGTLNRDEPFAVGASREVKEETGLEVTPEDLASCSKLCVKNTLYFIVVMAQTHVEPQQDVGNDANAVGWVKIECLQEMNRTKKININHHTKFLVRKIMHVDLDATLSPSSDQGE